ncbi:uncharacterized protein LOC117332377 [Pecten maximus]|uniref:uncharacterized protein LOC117332377 n=1 Tax=Pecten maximus TaxID=6579 RepID=UPI00145910AC|nr:uncharacterized protein LOC117332377 [Pecten maximus]
MNTPVTSPVTPNITARYLRINPQIWQWFITLRFDVSGCQVTEHTGGRARFERKSVTLTEDMVSMHTVIPSMSAAGSVLDCALACHSQSTCMSFTYQITNGVQWCTGYSAWIVVPGPISLNMHAFVNQDVLDKYGYKEDEEAAILYNIIEVRKNQESASATCTTMYTRLIKVNTTSMMERINNIVAGYFVLKHDFRFYVSGVYRSSVWSYSGEADVINSNLWSTGNPDQGQGHCVMLTQTGLSSVDCQQQLFSICGN